MHLFFRLIDDRGIKQSRVAAIMNVSPAQFTLVKQGLRTLNDDFRRKAVAAIEIIGLRRDDGGHFTADDLFLPASVPTGTEIVREVTNERIAV